MSEKRDMIDWLKLKAEIFQNLWEEFFSPRPKVGISADCLRISFKLKDQDYVQGHGLEKIPRLQFISLDISEDESLLATGYIG